MNNFILALLGIVILAACSGPVAPAADAGPADASGFADGAPDDAEALEDAGMALDGGSDDAAVESDGEVVLDASSSEDAAPAEVSLAVACARSDAAFQMSPCDPSFSMCAFTAASVPEASVVACETAILTALADVGGLSAMERCLNTMRAQSECRE